MKNDIRYSVLMAVYIKETAEHLELAIKSMLNQTVKTNDFVLVKDGPLIPELDKVINKYSTMYPGLFNIIELDKNMGLGYALKVGVEHCKNEWIARMDSDDFSIPERCEKQLELIRKKSNLDIVGSSIIEFSGYIGNVQAYNHLPETNEEIHEYAKRRCPFSHPSLMIRKSKILEVGNYREYHLCEDYELWTRMLANGAQCYNINEYLVYIRVDENFYKRRGGIKYLKSILSLKTELYKRGFYSFKDYCISSSAHIVMCLLPNRIRTFLYKKFLRKKI